VINGLTRHGVRIAAALVAALMLATVPAASAEEVKRPKTLFDMLFSKPETPEPAKPKVRPKAAAKPKASQTKPPARRRVGAAATAAPAALLAAPAPKIEKLADARVVLVVGDFFATGTAAGLEDAFSATNNVRVVDASKGDSGLVRDDFYNWPTEIGPLIDTAKPAVVVVMIGTNDRQQLTIDGKRAAVLSPEWSDAYRRRVAAVVKQATDRRVPLVWISQLPFRSGSVTADMLALNGIYRDAADNPRIGANFVDVWDGFVDETGKFIDRGPDINGQSVSLRSGQVNVTKAGYRKIAFYAERTLNRLLGSAAAPQTGQLGAGNLPPLTLGLPGLEANFKQMQPVDLTSPDLDGGDVLLGELAGPQPLPASTGAMQPGRIDDFMLPRLRR
jgi:uncharacterized protein